MGQAHGHHRYAPYCHDDRDENTGPKALEQDVGDRFKEGIGNEEDGEAGIVLTAGDVEGRFEAVELGVADVRAVEKGDEIEEAKPRDEAQVEFP